MMRPFRMRETPEPTPEPEPDWFPDRPYRGPRFTVCPDDHCLAPAEVIDTFSLESTDECGLTWHHVVVCVMRHKFTVPE